MVLISVAGWVTNHFASLPQAFQGRSDIVSALGSFVVGLLGNMYGRFFSKGASFHVMVTGILFQLPSGLSQGGIFSFVADASKNNSAEQYSTGFGVAQQLISVAIGLTVGLFVAAGKYMGSTLGRMSANPFQSLLIPLAAPEGAEPASSPSSKQSEPPPPPPFSPPRSFHVPVTDIAPLPQRIVFIMYCIT